jgi:hypothetical protein
MSKRSLSGEVAHAVAVRRETFQQCYSIAATQPATVVAVPSVPFLVRSIEFNFATAIVANSAQISNVAEVYCPELGRAVGAVVVGNDVVQMVPVTVYFSNPLPIAGTRFTFQFQTPSATGMIPWTDDTDVISIMARMIFQEA